ncbi:unnamed protein product [Candida verbasci]|uniref:Vacuolar ATPase assembly integral membrane protein VPH2 n=1 Tax=Candida verbasci TaxID=1227364 RepID=A0A9W4X9H8_9ASCO|nr:unnamed protein product [Candida verbasci]
MTKFELTTKIKDTILKSNGDSEYKTKLLSDSYISHVKLMDFYKKCKPTDSLLDLIKQSKLCIEPYKVEVRPKSKQFIKQMERLRLEEKEREYKRLINPPPEYNTLYELKLEDELITPQQAHKELKNQLTTIVNIMVSVGSVSYAIWYWTKSSWGLKESSRVLVTIFFGLLILIAEVVVYLGYINKIEDARTKERKKKEIKKVLRSIDLTN